MFDGQNLFDRATSAFGLEWGVDETIEGLVQAGRTPGIVVVGVDSPEDPHRRYAEYTAWDWTLDATPIRADGAGTADFVAEEVLALAQRTYGVGGTRARAGLAGSSMGGYMTLYAGVRHVDRFSRLLALSPVVLDEPMAGQHLRDLLSRTAFPPDTWAYLDMGSSEQLGCVDRPDRLVANLTATTAALRASPSPPDRLVSRVIAGATHDERAWGTRFGEVLLWAFAGGPEPS